MLDLDDGRWAELSHAYGAASDTPSLVRQLAERPEQLGPNDEPWFALWSSLCHQGDVYTASYAAIPHLVEIALSTATPVDFSFFLLPASVDVARINGRGPEVPDFLKQAYDEAMQRLPDCVSAHRGENWNQDMTIAVAAAIAVSKSHHDLAEAVMNLDQDWISKINNGEWD
jgi:hypothetical protein